MELFCIWVAIFVSAIIVEVVTGQLISLWFVPGAMICAILDLLDVGIEWQIPIFILLAIVGILFLRKPFMKSRSDSSTRTNIDAIVGEKCVVTEKIDNFAGCGQAKVKGQLWSAKGLQDDDVFEVGETLRIVAIEGVKIICKRIDQ